MKIKTLMDKKLLYFTVILMLSTVNVFAEGTKLQIVTVNYPLQFFTKSLAGDFANVDIPFPKGVDPAYWVPKADSIVKLQQADLVILNGADYAKWLPKVSLSRAKLLNSSADYAAEYIEIENATTHKHGAGGEHSHKGLAFTTWLDFSLAQRQAETIYKALLIKLPDNKDDITANHLALRSSLDAIDSELKRITSTFNNLPLVGSHPVYQYLRQRYQLNLTSVHWEPDALPSEKQWQKFEKLLTRHPAKWMLWEAKPQTEILERLEKLGVHSVVFAPSSNVPDDGDFLTIMHTNVENLKKIQIPENE